MKRVRPHLRTIIAQPFSWAAVSVVVTLELGMVIWFQPSPSALALMIGTGVALLALWPILLIRSPVFEQLHARARHAASLDAFLKTLEGSAPSFKSPATDCWTLAERIQREFGSRSFGQDVETALANLVMLTDNHVKFYARSQQFGDRDQREAMEARLLRQVEHVKNTRTGLLRLGGHLTMLEVDSANSAEIGSQLRIINKGLEEAILELDDRSETQARLDTH